MILVTVGTEQYGFDRLMSWITILMRHGLIQEQVIVQYGASKRLPSNAIVHKTVPIDRFTDLIQQARLVISHCGEGSLFMLEEIGTPYILVPRSVRFQEHVDDHQVELAIALSSIGIGIAWSPGDLVRFITAAELIESKPFSMDSAQALCYQLSLDSERFASAQLSKSAA
ncbi:glucosyl transferase [Pseudanabaenaceae cyanobacterium LEGE 13415]|nr:glucosyl transferase [Pseudanabaenaceae cyanobacterium LEGE 13415]